MEAEQASVGVPVNCAEQTALPVGRRRPGAARPTPDRSARRWPAADRSDHRGGSRVASWMDSERLTQERRERIRSAAVDPRSIRRYLKGLTARGLQRHDGFRTAVAYFEQAVAIQPDFGEAYAELALVQVQFLFGGPLTPREAIPKAEAAARRRSSSMKRSHGRIGRRSDSEPLLLAMGEKAIRIATRGRVARRSQRISTALIESLIRHRRFPRRLPRLNAADPRPAIRQCADRGRNSISRGGAARSRDRGVRRALG